MSDKAIEFTLRGHGGYRPGSGRPKKAVIKSKVNIALAPDADAIALEIGQGNRSLGIDIALREAKARRG